MVIVFSPSFARGWSLAVFGELLGGMTPGTAFYLYSKKKLKFLILLIY